MHGPPVACLEENHQFAYPWATSGLSTGKSVWLSMGHQWSIYRKISLSIHGPPVVYLEENQFGYAWATSGQSRLRYTKLWSIVGCLEENPHFDYEWATSGILEEMHHVVIN